MMTNFASNKWKYSTFGLLAILAVGFSFPQAFAHVTNNLSHNVEHILEAIAGIQSDVNDIQATTEEIAESSGFKMLAVELRRNPAHDQIEHIEILPFVEGTAYRGHMELAIIANPGNTVILTCGTDENDVFGFTLIRQEEGSSGHFERDFSCVSLTATFVDEDDSDGEDAGTAHVVGILSYSETDDFTTLSMDEDDA